MRSHVRLAHIICAALLVVCLPAGASENITRLGAEGLRAELDTLHGRVVLINFWATWCGPCREEIPTLMKLESDFADQGFTMVAVSLDSADSGDEAITAFMNKWFPGFSSFLNTEPYLDRIVSVVDPAWNEILPTTYLISRDGRVAERIQGTLTEEQFAEKIQRLLQ